ncbi:MAG: SDR family NAD(P)-dependent oxidoreductase [Pseudomonadota bacterium]
MAKSAEPRAAIVTGAACGIGFAVAQRLADDGAAVVLNDSDPVALDRAVAALSDRGGRCVACPGDAGDLAVIDELVASALALAGRLDWVIANAGITAFGPFLSFGADDFDRVVNLNLRGSFFLAQRAARQMIAQGDGGRVVLMSSVTGVQHHPDLVAYGMSKAGIRMLAKSMGVELAPHGITVNAVAPGATLTERTEQDPDYRSTWTQLNPNGRVGTVEDIASAVAYVLSDGARHVTAHTLVVDGGWSAVSPPP